MEVKYPNVKVSLVGKSGEAFAILGAVEEAMRRAGVNKADRDRYMDEATAGDYDALLQTTMKWVEVE